MKVFNSIFILITLLFMNCLEIKQINRFASLKKEINSVSCITIVNLHEVKYDKQKAPELWERVPSFAGDSITTMKINNYLKWYYSDKMTVKTTSFTSDSLINYNIAKLFNELGSIQKFDTCILNDTLIKALTTIDDRYIMLVFLEGYHFSKEYMNRIESKQARQGLLNALSMSSVMAFGGIGCISASQYDEGYSNIGFVLIDKTMSKVLYISSNSAHINPLEFSAIMKQLDQIRMEF